MNAPDQFELHVVPEGQKPVSMVLDQKIPNAATFTVHKQDHTLANMLRMQLLKNPKVLFVGYKIPHPLVHLFILKVQTTPDTSPLAELMKESAALQKEIGEIKLDFENKITEYKIQGGNDIVNRTYTTTVDRNF